MIIAPGKSAWPDANKEGMGECVIGRILPIWAQIACLPFGGQTPSDWKPNQYANIAQGTKDPKLSDFA